MADLSAVCAEVIRRRRRLGFTLLEMVIVVSVLAILFLLSVPNIQKVMNIVDEKGCQAQLKVIDSAILQYKLDTGDLPVRISDLVGAGLISEEQTACRSGQELELRDGQAYER